MNVLVTGGAGMLGATVADHLQSVGFHVTCLVRDARSQEIPVPIRTIACDLRDHHRLVSLLGSLEIDAVVHCAAITDLVLCENDPDLAHDVHVQATKQLTAIFPKARFIYISTDAVFDGEFGTYSEQSSPHPLNVYARTKLEGEPFVCSLPDGLVIRTNLYDIRRPGGKSLAEWAFEKLKTGQAITGFTDVTFNPLHTSQIAAVIQLLLAGQRSVRGVIHLGCDTVLSKYEFLRQLSESLSLPADLICPGELSCLPSGILRPRNTSLDITFAQSLFPVGNLSLRHGFGALARKVSSFHD